MFGRNREIDRQTHRGNAERSTKKWDLASLGQKLSPPPPHRHDVVYVMVKKLDKFGFFSLLKFPNIISDSFEKSTIYRPAWSLRRARPWGHCSCWTRCFVGLGWTRGAVWWEPDCTGHCSWTTARQPPSSWTTQSRAAAASRTRECWRTPDLSNSDSCARFLGKISRSVA